MRLSQHNAEMIVSEINTIIHEKMNIMDANGVIIASTDESRIGMFHAGAKRIIDEQLNELLITQNHEYAGTREGVNYPLVVRGEVIGVIGVTGNEQKTLDFAKIIKRMTEMLVLEMTLKEEKEIDASVRNRFLEEWLQGERHINQNFVERGKALGIDITIPRRMMALSVIAPMEETSVETLKRVEEADKYLQKLVLYESSNISLHTASYLIVGVTTRTDEEMMLCAKDFKTYIENRYKVRVAIGIDSPGTGDYLQACQAAVKARKALQSSLRRRSNEIRFYDMINLELISDEIPEIVKGEYIRKIFKGMSDEQIHQAMGVLEVFYQEDGSITQAAKKLFIHKNTLQNKLKKIFDVTSYDPRSIRYASLFYLAVYFYREMKEELYGAGSNFNEIED